MTRQPQQAARWRTPRTGLSHIAGPDGSLSATRTSVDHRQMDGTTITIPIAQVNSVNMAHNGDDWVLTVRSFGNEIVYHGTERQVKEMHTGILVQQRMGGAGALTWVSLIRKLFKATSS